MATTFSKKHYDAIAAGFAKKATWTFPHEDGKPGRPVVYTPMECSLVTLALVFMRDNPAFSPAKFFMAGGASVDHVAYMVGTVADLLEKGN